MKAEARKKKQKHRTPENRTIQPFNRVAIRLAKKVKKVEPFIPLFDNRTIKRVGLQIYTFYS